MACEQDGGVTWNKSSLMHESDGDVWDDTALIEAYDKAVAQLKGDIVSYSPELNHSKHSDNDGKRKKKKKKGKGSNKKSWKVGSKCLAIYSEDGLYYEATILSLEARTAFVKYDYYTNEEEVDIDQLLPIEKKSEMQVTNRSYEQQSTDTESMVRKTTKNNKIKATAGWSISDLCYAPTECGIYEHAVINSFNEESTTCVVTFVTSQIKREVQVCLLQSKANTWTNNYTQEDHRKAFTPSPGPSNIWPLPHAPPMQAPLMYPGTVFPPSMGSAIPGWNNTFAGRHHNPAISVPPFPPPPVLPNGIKDGDEEALANMLMSWYMSGYHTGYYQGKKESKQSSKKNMNSNSGLS